MKVVLVSQYPRERGRPKGGVAAVTVVLAPARPRRNTPMAIIEVTDVHPGAFPGRRSTMTGPRSQ
jgi:hypothetical protein